MLQSLSMENSLAVCVGHKTWLEWNSSRIRVACSTFVKKKTETELGDNTKNNGKKEVSKLTRAQQKQEFVKLIKRLLAAYSIHSLCEARVRKCERGTSN